MNKVILMGRLTRDPETRYTQTNNTVVSSFSLAVNRRFVRQGEERQADFINIVAWSKLGEFCSKYFKKGQQVGIIGRIQTRTWDDDNGVKHYVTEVVAEEAYFADSKRDGDSAGNGFDSTFGNPFGTTMPGSTESSDFEVSSSDDLPF
jgi:single-strand DNA-binding protein